MKVLGYVRVSSDKQDLEKQKQQILDYAFRNKVVVDEIIDVAISSKKNEAKRKIDLLYEKLDNEDCLIVVELSRLGRNMFETLNIINELTQKGVNIIFIRQPELSTNNSHSKLLLAIYSYLAESEREYISIRTKDAIRIGKQNGKRYGRPKGSRNKKPSVCEMYRDEIQGYLKMNIPLNSILKIINNQYDKKISYGALQYWIANN